MSAMRQDEAIPFHECVSGLLAGDFSRLEPLFVPRTEESSDCAILQWYREGRFADHPRALAEALTCACFLGRRNVSEILLAGGLAPSGGNGTGLDALHWAANRGQLETVRLLLRHGAPLEVRSSYGGTVLGTAIWSALHEPRADHLAIVAALLEAGAEIDGQYPSGDARIDELLRRHGAAE